MLGTFTSVYKFLISALSIATPALSSSNLPTAFDGNGGAKVQIPITAVVVQNDRKTQLQLSAQAQLILPRKQTRRWHAALAGAIAGGLAIIWEKRTRRSLIAQQLFVRGLQGSYNSYTTRKGIHIPHGDALVFALACGQIMHAFLLRPDALPHSYRTWLGQAARVPGPALNMNSTLVREGRFNLSQLDKILSLPNITSSNKAELLLFRRNYLNPSSPHEYVYRYAPCSAIHPTVSVCSYAPLDGFFSVFKWVLPVYGALHFIPILFKWKNFLKDPGSVIVRAGLGSMRSSAFMCFLVVTNQTLFCYKHKLHRYLSRIKLGLVPTNLKTTIFKRIPQPVVDLLVSKFSFLVIGIFSGLSILVEEKRRRTELMMFSLTKSLESLWITLRGHGLVFETGNWGEILLGAMGMALVMVSLHILIELRNPFLISFVRQLIKMTHSICLDSFARSYTSLLGQIEQCDS
ncbi:hypothetical protein Ac2012v2_004485 [Leucoagaricus gongylophorus]